MSVQDIRKNLSFVLVGKFFEKAVGFVALVIYARTFSVFELSIIPLIFLAGGLVLVVFGFGILPTITLEIPRLVVSGRGKALSLLRRTLAIGVLAVILSGILIALGREFVNAYLFKPIPGINLAFWIAAAVSVQALFTLLTQMLSGLSKFSDLALANIMVSLIRPIATLLLYDWNGVSGIVAGMILASTLGCLLALWSMRRELIEESSERYSYRAILSLSWPFYFEGYVMYLRSQGDQLVVTTMLGAKALALYYIARRFYDLLKVIADSVDAVLIPTLSRLSTKTRADFGVWWHKFLRAGVFISVPAALVSAACVPLYIAVLGKGDYEQAAAPAVILCLAFVIDILKVVVIRSVFVLFPPIKRLQITTLESVLMLPMLIVGAAFAGAAGVATAYASAGVATVWYAYLMLRKEIGLRVDRADWMPVVLPSVFAVSALLGVIWAASRWYGTEVYVMTVATVLGAGIFLLIYVNLISKETLLTILESVSGKKEFYFRRLLFRLRIRGEA